MAYKLVVTEHADELLDRILRYLIYQLKNEQAAVHLLDEMKNIYDRLEENPLQFPISRDTYLADKGYHEAVIGQMNYIIVFCIETETVNIVGIFHQLENYWKKCLL
ncbi:MAG: type II toxin-antitoxin system RelE/ParE family toxin [Muribaculaceae bacterium]|nr:type II toxin-antitoxin system RelE/ParE family toxin [Roseburia sp.]MCM1429814.1 type II toxin-antitoxin system RelE/ParE family toxin [Muribaculaceae bacterium]MCM1492865.1 type II toxin-antitoxin system RelE/ParE family toxin [Muribaculaceae bacterium]